MKKLVISLCVLSLILGMVGIAGAVTYPVKVYNQGPYGHDYAIGVYDGSEYSNSWEHIYWSTTQWNDDWYLATITSAEEQSLITSLFTNAALGGEYWMGAYQEPKSSEPDGGWAWVTGETWSYTNWYSGEPNDLNAETYAAVWSSDGWAWNDEGNLGNITGFVLERNAVPEPTTLLLLGLGLVGLAGLRRKIQK